MKLCRYNEGAIGLVEGDLIYPLGDALAATDVAGITGRLKMNPQRNVDKPAVVQEVTFKDGAMKFVYKATINP